MVAAGEEVGEEEGEEVGEEEGEEEAEEDEEEAEEEKEEEEAGEEEEVTIGIPWTRMGRLACRYGSSLSGLSRQQRRNLRKGMVDSQSELNRGDCLMPCGFVCCWFDVCILSITDEGIRWCVHFKGQVHKIPGSLKKKEEKKEKRPEGGSVLIPTLCLCDSLAFRVRKIHIVSHLSIFILLTQFWLSGADLNILTASDNA